MDATWPPELTALRAEALALGSAAAAGRSVLEDSWVIADDRDFSLELGRRGWLGMTNKHLPR